MKKNSLPIIVVLSLLSFGLGYDLGNAQNSPMIVSEVQPASNLDLEIYEDVWSTILDRYLESGNIDKNTVIDESIKGMVKALDDPYSSYMNSEETEMFMSDLDSELEGIGAVLGMESERVVIETPLKASPAEAAGLQTGDIIVAVDGNDITDQGLLEVVKQIRGPKGTTVVLSIIRENSQEAFDVNIVRDKITLESVTFEQQDDLFYISINQFSDDTLKEFQSAATQALLNDSKGIILDLRFNGGGYLDSAVHILGEFLETNLPAVQMQGKDIQSSKTLTTSGPARLNSLPVAVLINQASASAAEIVAGTLQDFGRAIVVGQKSYGKGTIQDVIPFRDGSTLRITIAKWLTGKGQDINENGISPDFMVEISEEDVNNSFDSQLEKARELLTEKLANQ